jgi:hypothetical protein
MAASTIAAMQAAKNTFTAASPCFAVELAESFLLARYAQGLALGVQFLNRTGGGKRRGEGIQSRLPFFWRLSPFPFAGVPVVAGDAALDHFVTPPVPRHEEGSKVAAAEAKPTKGDHDDELQQLTHGSVLY